MCGPALRHEEKKAINNPKKGQDAKWSKIQLITSFNRWPKLKWIRLSGY